MKTMKRLICLMFVFAFAVWGDEVNGETRIGLLSQISISERDPIIAFPVSVRLGKEIFSDGQYGIKILKVFVDDKLVKPDVFHGFFEIADMSVFEPKQPIYIYKRTASPLITVVDPLDWEKGYLKFDLPERDSKIEIVYTYFFSDGSIDGAVNKLLINLED